MQSSICIVIPCFNESTRLPVEKIKEFSKHYYFVLVDDGSTDNTAGMLEALRSEKIIPLILPKNGGKAEAVRKGALFASQYFVNESDVWIGFMDADLATPLEEVEEMFKYKKIFFPNSTAVWGSRWLRLGSQIDRKVSRHYAGRVFATLAYLITKIPTYDSQCGAKFFSKDLISLAFNEPFVTRWLFDIEIYFRLKSKFGNKVETLIVEYPLLKWSDVEGSKVNLKEMLFKVVPQLLKIKRKYCHVQNS